MKILKISFKNIHSLEGEHHIDFEDNRFTQNNLFAITGATGSGKSTILDVIVLALYNQMPRISRAISGTEIQKNGAIITHGKTEAYARIKYRCERGIFTSEWMIRIKKTGKIDKVQMQLYDAQGIPLGQNKQDIPKANAENIGLTYEQFIKSVMLAQGDFAVFLKVNKKERSALLEQITGTDIYRILGKLAYEKNKEAENQIKLLEHSKQISQQKLLSDEEYSEKTQLLSDTEKLFSVAQNKSAILEKQLTRKENVINLSQKITDFNNKISFLSDKKHFFQQEKGKKLDLHQKTDSFAEDLLSWKRFSKDLEQNQFKLEQKSAEKEHLYAEKQYSIIQICNFIQKESEEIHLSSEMETFRQQIIELQNKKNQKQNQYHDQKQFLISELKPLHISWEENNYNDLKSLLQNIDKKVKIDKKNLQKALQNIDFQEIEKEIVEKENIIRQIQQAEKVAFQILHKEKFVNEKLNKKNENQKIISSIPEQIKLLNENLISETKELNYLNTEKENKNLRKTLEEYREKLVENVPCPLCGATHHPWAKEVEHVTDELEKQIENQHLKINILKDNLASQKGKLEVYTKDIKVLENDILILKKEIASHKKQFEKNFPTYNLNENWEKILKEAEQFLQNVRRYQSLLTEEQVVKLSIPRIDKILEIIEEGRKINTELKQKIGNKDVNKEIDSYQKQWRTIQLKESNISQQISDLEDEIKISHQQKLSIEQQLHLKIKPHFTSIDDAFRARLPFEQAQLLQKEKETLDNNLKTFQDQLFILEKEYQTLKKDDVDVSKKDLEENKLKLERDIKELGAKLEEFRFSLREYNQNKQQVQLLEEKIKLEMDKNRSWRLLNMLIGDATGTKFNQFAQDLTLQQLIQLANKRLFRLSPRYLLSQPLENEDDSLVVIDKDMGNKRRSVKTLSGGETFILSLALALALSDLASNNIKIESLFIDEGFGTLDPETLDQTLDTLERLQQENNKMIGIISHVEALKERISTQIRLQQKGSGFSTLTIFPENNFILNS